MAMDTDPFSEESLRKLEEWRRRHAAASQRRSSFSGYAYRGIGLALLYGVASIWGHPGVPEAIVIVAIVAYYCGQAAARIKRP
jgi:hypothetical protein